MKNPVGRVVGSALTKPWLGLIPNTSLSQKSQFLRAIKMAQGIRMFATKLGNLSPLPRAHTVGENWLSEVVL